MAAATFVDDSGPTAKRVRLCSKTPPAFVPIFGELGCEDKAARQQVYLVTVARVLPGTRASSGYKDVAKLTRAELLNMVRDAFDNPVAGASGGRPRASTDSPIDFTIVARELHADGSAHFHVVVKLFTYMRFSAAKLTLASRHKVPTHWSCTHRHVFSAVRYICTPSATKPIVDAEPAVWTHDGRMLDLVELSREPFVAVAWRKRRERLEATAAVSLKKPAAFNKLDFTALILSKHLHTKAGLLAYVQEFGSPAAQLFTSKNQRKLVEFIEDAQEYADAKESARAEKLTDWEILCRAAELPCPHAPGECSYAAAVAEIFKRNAATLSQHLLATALRRVLRDGPSKTVRVPLLVGPSNTGKSTLLYPFDDLFGPKFVFHKPAVGSTFALRNIVKRKRLIFWDDYRPVEFAHEKTVPVATFLSLFMGKDVEIQVSQSFNDGNLDIKWNRGVVFTAKEEGLWQPTTRVSAEDVRHLRNRVEEFRFTEVVPELKDVESCAPCMARWILKFSEEVPPVAAACAAVSLPTSTSAAASYSAVAGFGAAMASAKLPAAVADALFGDILAAGAVDVSELSRDDWPKLPSWSKLRPLEVRRLVAAMGF